MQFDVNITTGVFGPQDGEVRVSPVGCSGGQIKWDLKHDRGIEGVDKGKNGYWIQNIDRNKTATLKATCTFKDGAVCTDEITIKRPTLACANVDGKGQFESLNGLSKFVTSIENKNQIKIEYIYSSDVAKSISWSNDGANSVISSKGNWVKYFPVPKKSTIFEGTITLERNGAQCSISIPYNVPINENKTTPIIPLTQCTSFEIVANPNVSTIVRGTEIVLSTEGCNDGKNFGTVTWTQTIGVGGKVKPLTTTTYEATCVFAGQTIIAKKEIKVTYPIFKVEPVNSTYTIGVSSPIVINASLCTDGILNGKVTWALNDKIILEQVNPSKLTVSPTIEGQYTYKVTCYVDGKPYQNPINVVVKAEKPCGTYWATLTNQPPYHKECDCRAYTPTDLGLANIYVRLNGCEGAVSWKYINNGILGKEVTGFEYSVTNNSQIKIPVNSNIPNSPYVIFKCQPKNSSKECPFVQGVNIPVFFSEETELNNTTSKTLDTPPNKATYPEINNCPYGKENSRLTDNLTDNIPIEGYHYLNYNYDTGKPIATSLVLQNNNCTSNISKEKGKVFWYRDSFYNQLVAEPRSDGRTETDVPKTTVTYYGLCTYKKKEGKNRYCPFTLKLNYKDPNKSLRTEEVPIKESNTLQNVGSENAVADATTTNCGFMTTQKAVGDILKNLICDNGKLIIEAPITTEKVEILKNTILQNPIFEDKGITLPAITDEFLTKTSNEVTCQTAIEGLVKDVKGTSLKEDFNNLATDPNFIDGVIDAMESCNVTNVDFTITLAKSLIKDKEYVKFIQNYLFKDFLDCLKPLHGTVENKSEEFILQQVIKYMDWKDCYQSINHNPILWDNFKNNSIQAINTLLSTTSTVELIDWGKYSEKEIEEIAKNMLIQKAEKMYAGVSTLTQAQKGALFRTNSKATIAILLYEFATGTGQETTIFDETKYGTFAIVEELKSLDFIKEAETYYYDQNRNNFYGQLPTRTFPYEFSPTGNPLRLFNLPKSIPEHIKACAEIYKQDNYLRLFLGGTVVTMDANDEGGGGDITFSVTDGKNRNSLFLHASQFSKIAVNVPRSEGNLPLSTTKQKYIFTFKLDKSKVR